MNGIVMSICTLKYFIAVYRIYLVKILKNIDSFPFKSVFNSVLNSSKNFGWIKKEFNKEANSFSMSSVFMFTPYNITYMRFFQLDT